MRLSTSLSRNILEATVGGVINKFKIRKRRDTLFFEDILAGYIKECEDGGYSEELKSMAQQWAALYIKELVPKTLKKLPPSIFFNTIVIRIWVNLGLMDDANFTKRGRIIELQTKRETMTRIVGANDTMVGYYLGILNTFFGSELIVVKTQQKRQHCSYTFELLNKPFAIDSRKRDEYIRLNYLPETKGLTLKDTLRKGIFQLDKSNKLRFHGKSIVPLENTIFHIIANRGIMLERLPHISYGYFKEIVKGTSTNEKRLSLLKNVLQIMGWGVIKILVEDEGKIIIEIRYPPHGLQVEEDNWNFLIQTILGYLWLLDKKFKINRTALAHNRITIEYINR